MSNQPSIRLNKVLRELNISLDRVVEFLNEKGIEIEARPTTKIDDTIYKVLLDEFETDKSKRDASQEISEEKRKEKERLKEIQEQKEQERLQALEVQKEAESKVVSPKVALKGLTPVGKINLEEKKQTHKKTPDTSAAKEKKSLVTPKAEVTATQEQTPPDNKASEVDQDQDSIKTKYKTLSGPKKRGKPSI